MRLTTRLTTIAILAIAAIAITTPPAAAQTIEVTDEASGEHCGTVTVTDHAVSGGCPLQLQSNGEVHLVFDHDTETRCLLDLEATIDENGHGYIYDQTLTNGPSGACFLTPCAEPSGARQPWDAELREDTVEGLRLDFEVCIEDIFFHGENHWFIQGIDLTATGHDHIHYTTNGPLSGQGEPSGELTLDAELESTVDVAHPELEITHL